MLNLENHTNLDYMQQGTIPSSHLEYKDSKKKKIRKKYAYELLAKMP